MLVPFHNQAEIPCAAAIPLKRLQRFKGKRGVGSEAESASGADLGQQNILRGLLQMAHRRDGFVVISVRLRSAAEGHQDLPVERIGDVPQDAAGSADSFQFSPTSALEPVAVFDFQAEHSIVNRGFGVEDVVNFPVGAPGFTGSNLGGRIPDLLQQSPPLRNFWLRRRRRRAAVGTPESDRCVVPFVLFVILILDVLAGLVGHGILHQLEMSAAAHGA